MDCREFSKARILVRKSFIQLLRMRAGLVRGSVDVCLRCAGWRCRVLQRQAGVAVQQILHQRRPRYHLRGRAEAGPPHLPRFLPPPLRGLRDIRIAQDDRAGGRADPRRRTLPAHSLLLLILFFSFSSSPRQSPSTLSTPSTPSTQAHRHWNSRNEEPEDTE